MRWLVKIFVCITGMLILNARARGDDGLRTGNPYTTIATRNVFGLRPSPTLNPLAPTPPAIPGITLTGLTSILGIPAVLFKVTDQSPSGQVISNKTYLLNEGQTQDGIEVTRVETGVVFFNNHGTMQQIRLGAKDDSSGTASGGLHHRFN